MSTNSVDFVQVESGSAATDHKRSQCRRLPPPPQAPAHNTIGRTTPLPSSSLENPAPRPGSRVSRAIGSQLLAFDLRLLRLGCFFGWAKVPEHHQQEHVVNALEYTPDDQRPTKHREAQEPARDEWTQRRRQTP